MTMESQKEFDKRADRGIIHCNECLIPHCSVLCGEGALFGSDVVVRIWQVPSALL